MSLLSLSSRKQSNCFILFDLFSHFSFFCSAIAYMSLVDMKFPGSCSWVSAYSTALSLLEDYISESAFLQVLYLQIFRQLLSTSTFAFQFHLHTRHAIILFSRLLFSTQSFFFIELEILELTSCQFIITICFGALDSALSAFEAIIMNLSFIIKYFVSSSWYLPIR